MTELNYETELVNVRPAAGFWSYPLVCLFQVTTGSALFFACLQASPVAAIILTLFVTPAIVRTTLISEQYRKRGAEFNWTLRSRHFVGSLAYVALIGLFGLAVFSLVSFLFGLLGLIASFMVQARTVGAEAIVLGTVGGMVWGAGAAFVAIVGMVIKTWFPAELGDYI